MSCYFVQLEILASAIRGHNDKDSNFHQLLMLQANSANESGHKILEWITKKKEKYTSHGIKNEILSLMANRITRQVAANLQSAQFYTIMMYQHLK